MIVTSAPAAAGKRTAYASPVALGLTSPGRILVDPASSQVFVSSPTDNAIVVLDLNGTIKKTIQYEAGADAMVVVGATLYVTLTTLGAIDEIDTDTLQETEHLVTGLYKPQDLTYAGGKLWTTTGQCGGTAVELASVDPAALSPSVTLYPSAFANSNMLNYCAEFATNHAFDPSFMVAWATDLSPSSTTVFDVSSGSPVQTANANIAEFRDSVVDPDGAHLKTTGLTNYKLSDLTPVGVPVSGSASGVDVSAANGGIEIAASDNVYGFTFTAYSTADTSSPIAQYSFSNYAYTGGADRLVAFAPDGLTAYGVTFNTVPSTQATLEVMPIPYVAPPGSPAPPTNVTADSGVGDVTVSWTPGDQGSSAITGFTITASTGTVVQVGPQHTSVTIAGLAPSVHTFTVSATNSYGTSAPSDPSPSVFVGDGGTYHPVAPSRILDTRNGNGGFPLHRVAAGTAIPLQVTGRGGVPASGVSAIVMNVTVTNPTGAGFVTAYPAGAFRPNSSNINYVAGLTVPNLVEVAVGVAGQVSLFVGGSSTNLVADIQGWVGDASNSYGAAGTFGPVTPVPVRILDTRIGMGAPRAKLGPGQSLLVQVTGVNGLTPQPYLSAAVINLTVTNPTAASYLTVYPSDVGRPTSSNVNFVTGQTVANRVIVPLNADGQIRIYNGFGTVDVIADVSGLYCNDAVPCGGGFVATVPQRLFDSRSCNCKLGPRDVLTLTWNPGPGFPDTFISAFVLNMTVTNTTGNGYLTVYPDDGSMGLDAPPTASDINYRVGQTIANLTAPGLNIYNETFDVYNGGASTDVVIDAMGYYAPIPSGTSSVAPLVIVVSEIGSYHSPRMLISRVRATRTAFAG